MIFPRRSNSKQHTVPSRACPRPCLAPLAGSRARQLPVSRLGLTGQSHALCLKVEPLPGHPLTFHIVVANAQMPREGILRVCEAVLRLCRDRCRFLSKWQDVAVFHEHIYENDIGGKNPVR